MEKCPVCLSIDGHQLVRGRTRSDRFIFLQCAVCGPYCVDKFLIDDYLENPRTDLSRRIRGTLSHWIRLNENRSSEVVKLTEDIFSSVENNEFSLPTPDQAALSIVSFIGDHVQTNGERIAELPPEFHAIVGTSTRNMAIDLLLELKERGLVRASDGQPMLGISPYNFDLTLSGWEAYRQERKGKKVGGYGFLAMKFGDDRLESLVSGHLKPAIANLGYELVDMRDVAMAGVIDNIMRMRIRDANFVIADLTHGNAGAYWEAGYAEGLGKPVIYICEQEIFDQESTHFDTNHCTTVMWALSDPERFCSNLIATLKRSLI
jgi:hypothetical protein